MKANSGLKKNRTKIQMVLTALVILSVVRQFSWEITTICFWES